MGLFRPLAGQLYLTLHVSAVVLAIFILSHAQQPNVGQDRLFLEVSRSHTVTQHSRWGFSVQVIGPSQRPLPDNTYNTYKRQTPMSAAEFEPAIQ
jgi:hypothetical protein